MTLSLFKSNKLIAITVIALGGTHKEAAKKANVTPGTISEWMHDPAFKAKLNEIKLENLTQAQDKHRGLAMSAVNTLADIMCNSKSDKARFDAAKYILDTVQIAPTKEGGLWWIGPTTREELESKEHTETMQKKLQAIYDELNIL